jgi:hypothetical protein
VGKAFRVSGQAKLPVKINCLDPLNRIRQLKVDVWAGSEGLDRPASNQAPKPQPGDGPRETIAISGADGLFSGEIPVPSVGSGQVLWVQPVVVHGNGSTVWEPAISVVYDPEMVLERREALIEFKPPTGPVDRTLKLTRNTNLTSFLKTGQISPFSQKMDCDILESLSPDSRGTGTGVRLTMGESSFIQEVNGTKQVMPPETVTGIRDSYPTFLVDATHTCKERGNRTFSNVAPAFRPVTAAMFETFCTTYEATTLPVPNRTVKPLEKWPAKFPMLVIRDNRRTVNDVHLTCTYEGTRTVAGHNEAYLTLTGVVKGRGAQANADLGNVTGHALVDLDKGFISLVKLTISSEVVSEEAGVRVLWNDESVIERSEGNVLGLKNNDPTKDPKAKAKGKNTRPGMRPTTPKSNPKGTPPKSGTQPPKSGTPSRPKR